MRKRTPQTIAKTITSATLKTKLKQKLSCLCCNLSLKGFLSSEMAQTTENLMKKKLRQVIFMDCSTFKLSHHINSFSSNSSLKLKIFDSFRQVLTALPKHFQLEMKPCATDYLIHSLNLTKIQVMESSYQSFPSIYYYPHRYIIIVIFQMFKFPGMVLVITSKAELVRLHTFENASKFTKKKFSSSWDFGWSSSSHSIFHKQRAT